MANVKKIAKTAAVTAAAGAGLYLATGGILCEKVLGRAAINSAPEEILNDPEKMHRYLRDEVFRAADDWYIENNPADTLLKNEKGEVLHSKIICTKEPSNKWVIVLHGYKSCPRDMAVQAHHLYKKGFNTLLAFQRGHKNSEKMHTSMGYFESCNVLSWINYIVSIDQDAEIVLLGCSMGAATAMLATGKNLPQNVKCAVADCGYTSFWEMGKNQVKNLYHLPVVPFLYAANSYSKLFLRWDFKQCSPLKAVSHSTTPTLFVHGELDTFVPYDMLNTLYDACSAEKDMLSVPDAAHNKSCEIHPELYWSKIDGFIDKYMSKKTETIEI